MAFGEAVTLPTVLIQRASGQEREKERELIHELIWRGENSDTFNTGKEPVADGGWVQGRGGGQNDEAQGPLPMITWSYWPFSARASQLAAELADRRPILHLAKGYVTERAIVVELCEGC